MKEEKYEPAETKCHECGKNEFRLTRMTEHQVLAECIHCRHPHTLDSTHGIKRRSALLNWFTVPKATERCVECRSQLKTHDTDFQTGRARAQCEQCGLLHIYKKDRLHGWHIIRITRHIGSPTPDEAPKRKKKDKT